MSNTNAQPTMGDLWNGFNDEPQITSPTKTPDLTEAAAAAEEKKDPPAPATPAAPANPPAPATPPAQEETKPTEEKPEEGQEGEEQNEEGEGQEGEEGEDNPMAFWNDVNTLRGRELLGEDGKPVDLSTFEDPTSPEAYMAVENAVRNEAMRDYDAYVEETDPRAYAYFLHRRNGGTDEEFFQQASDQLPEYEQFKGNVDLQKKVLTSALKGRGVTDKVINLTIQEAEKDGTLFTEADREYKARQTEDEAVLNRLKADQKAREDAYKASVEAIEGDIDNVIFKGGTKRLVIPEAKRNEFATFLKGKLHHHDATGTFLIGQQVTKENLTDVIEALYFQFSGGDVSKLVKAAVKTTIARRLGANVNKAKAQAQSSQGKENAKSDVTSLTDIW